MHASAMAAPTCGSTPISLCSTLTSTTPTSSSNSDDQASVLGLIPGSIGILLEYSCTEAARSVLPELKMDGLVVDSDWSLVVDRLCTVHRSFSGSMLANYWVILSMVEQDYYQSANMEKWQLGHRKQRSKFAVLQSATSKMGSAALFQI